MSDGLADKLSSAMAECRLHAQVLAQALATLPAAFTPDEAAVVDVERRRSLDQAAYRYMATLRCHPWSACSRQRVGTLARCAR